MNYSLFRFECKFENYIAAFACCIALVASSFNGLVSFGAEGENRQPNVLFIAIDDLNDWVGCMGANPDAKTPNIDRLAAPGMVFTNAECASPACVPSRSALMTGKLPHNTGLYTNVAGEFRKYQDLKDLVTIPQYFSRHGYHTMGVGKILHSGPNKTDWDDPSSITYFKNPLPPGIEPNSRRNVQEFLEDWLPVDVDKSEMTDWKMAKWAAERLQQTHEKPLFLGCGFFRPHVPLHAPPEYYDRFPLDKLTLPKIKLDDRADLGPGQQRPNPTVVKIVSDDTLWRKGVQAYLANIAFVDECVGLVLDALDASPHRENTIVMLWSDHGHHKGEKFHWGKFTLWEESARSVLICAGPGVNKSTKCEQPVNLVDMYPTLVEMCGLPACSCLDGSSFHQQLLNPEAQRRQPSVTANRNGFSLRNRRWRLIVYHDGAEELYDYDADPMEWTNLASDPEHAKIIRELEAYLPENPAVSRSVDRDKSRIKAKEKDE